MTYMTNLQILEGFEREINLLDNAIEKPNTDESLFWLNQGVAKFMKLRFNTDFIHHTSYEQNEKRRIDLIDLFKEVELPLTGPVEYPSYNEYQCTYPEDFQFALNEDVVITDTEGGHEMNTCVFECTADSFMYRVNNSLTDFHYRYHRARPLRVRSDEGFKLLTDKNYNITKFTLGYLRHPNEITLENPTSEYTDFQAIIMPEIIKMAAQMYIENKKDERYKTITAEVNTQE